MGGWYDCGKLDALLDTNATLLAKGAARRRDFPGVQIQDPVYIEDGVTIERSSIGPNVSLEAGTHITDCAISNAIIGRDVRIARARLDGAMLGARSRVEGIHGTASLGEDSEVVAS